MYSFTNQDIDEIIAFVRNNNIENVAVQLLFKIGFKCNLCGSKYLQDGIVLMYNSQMSMSFKQLYLQVSLLNDTSPCRVERAIRHCINECFSSGKLLRLNEVAKCQIIDSKYPPTNGEFISALCTWISILRGEPFCSVQKN